MHVMNQDELNKVELPAIEQLKQLGWKYIHGAELNPDSLRAEGSGARAYLRSALIRFLGEY